MPSSTPGGIRTWIVRSARVLPCPPQPAQASVIRLPVPPHVPQGEAVTIWPRIDWRTRWVCPVPEQVSHICGSVPGAAPVASQTSQATAVLTVTSWADPNTGIAQDDNWGITPGVQIFFYGRNKLALNWDLALFSDDTSSASSFKLMLQGYF